MAGLPPTLCIKEAYASPGVHSTRRQRHLGTNVQTQANVNRKHSALRCYVEHPDMLRTGVSGSFLDVLPEADAELASTSLAEVPLV
jgi:hypothetical protein